MYKSEILKEIEAYGFIHSISKPEKLDKILLNEKITLYSGFDLTAPSLHVGNLMQIMFARKFLKHGHNVIFLLGGATTKIGDPTGRDKTRQVLSEHEIEENRKGIIENFSSFVDITSPQVKILNNIEWLGSFNYLDFLRETGIHFTVNRMLAMESVRLRIQNGSMNFVEFNYMLLQGYDFAYLNKYYSCVLQIGGSDQWGNITEGMELCARMNKSESFALCSPLITRSDGKKMGKSEEGAIFLSKKLTTSFEYFQYFRNMPDADIPQMLKYYTELSLPEIERLSKLVGKEVNEAKKILAFEATKIARGEEEASKALKEAESIFSGNSLPEDESLVIYAPKSGNLLKTLVENNIIKSLTAGRTLVSQGSVKVNGKTLQNPSFTFEGASEIKLALGKKKHYKIIVQ